MDFDEDLDVGLEDMIHNYRNKDKLDTDIVVNLLHEEERVNHSAVPCDDDASCVEDSDKEGATSIWPREPAVIERNRTKEEEDHGFELLKEIKDRIGRWKQNGYNPMHLLFALTNVYEAEKYISIDDGHYTNDAYYFEFSITPEIACSHREFLLPKETGEFIEDNDSSQSPHRYRIRELKKFDADYSPNKNEEEIPPPSDKRRGSGEGAVHAPPPSSTKKATATTKTMTAKKSQIKKKKTTPRQSKRVKITAIAPLNRIAPAKEGSTKVKMPVSREKQVSFCNNTLELYYNVDTEAFKEEIDKWVGLDIESLCKRPNPRTGMSKKIGEDINNMLDGLFKIPCRQDKGEWKDLKTLWKAECILAINLAKVNQASKRAKLPWKTLVAKEIDSRLGLKNGYMDHLVRMGKLLGTYSVLMFPSKDVPTRDDINTFANYINCIAEDLYEKIKNTLDFFRENNAQDNELLDYFLQKVTNNNPDKHLTGLVKRN